MSSDEPCFPTPSRFYGKGLRTKRPPESEFMIARIFVQRKKGYINMNSSYAVSVLVISLLGLAFSHAVDQPATLRQAKPVVLTKDPHLVGWWKFDELSGQNAADSSGQNHPGILQDKGSFEHDSQPGVVGKALKFNGATNGLQIAGYKGIPGAQPRTIAAWIKAGATTGEIISWGSDDSGKMWIFGFIRSRIGVTPKGGYLYMKSDIHDNQWHHVAVVMEEADPPNLHDHVKLFKDGVLAEIDDIGLLDLWPIDTGDHQDVRIGRRFQGLMDEVRLYDCALSEEEINALFKLGTSRPAAQP